MNIHFGNQSQFELFPRTTGEPIENSAPRFIFSRLVLTFDNLIVAFVFIIVSLIIAFSIGVERGRAKARVARPVAQLTNPATVAVSVMPHPQISLGPSVSAPATNPPATLIANIPAPTPRKFLASAPAVMAVMPQTATLQKGVDKGYTVQVASYKKQSMAAKEAGELKRQGLESFVSSKGQYTIVCVGKFSTLEQAKQWLGKLKKRYKDSTIRSL